MGEHIPPQLRSPPPRVLYTRDLAPLQKPFRPTYRATPSRDPGIPRSSRCVVEWLVGWQLTWNSLTDPTLARQLRNGHRLKVLIRARNRRDESIYLIVSGGEGKVFDAACTSSVTPIAYET